MVQIYKWQIGAVAFFVFGISGVASGQRYSPPTAENIQNFFTAPTVGRRVDYLATLQRNAGYPGGNSPFNYYLGGGGGSSGPRVGLGATSPTRSSKPFSSYSSAPTVSPYLNLFRTDLNGGGNFNYSTLVQPQLQQQQVNQQLERQALQANRRLQSIAAQADYNPEGAKDQYPTGHQTVFNYTGRYYPVPQVRQKRR